MQAQKVEGHLGGAALNFFTGAEPIIRLRADAAFPSQAGEGQADGLPWRAAPRSRQADRADGEVGPKPRSATDGHRFHDRSANDAVFLNEGWRHMKQFDFDAGIVGNDTAQKAGAGARHEAKSTSDQAGRDAFRRPHGLLARFQQSDNGVLQFLFIDTENEGPKSFANGFLDRFGLSFRLFDRARSGQNAQRYRGVGNRNAHFRRLAATRQLHQLLLD